MVVKAVSKPQAGGAPDVAGPLSDTKAVHAARIGNLRLLIVDDDANTRAMLLEAFDLCGATVCAVPNAEMARRAIAQWRPNAFLSDIDMPGEDGIELIRSVRDLPPGEGGTLPAIAFTGYARDADRMLDAGFDAVVAKPIALDVLIDTIVHVVDDSRGPIASGRAGLPPARDS